jgi:hypothetical protein
MFSFMYVVHAEVFVSIYVHIKKTTRIYIHTYIHTYAYIQLAETPSVSGQDTALTATITHAGAGSYTFSRLVTKAGKYLISLLIDKEFVSGSPLVMNVIVGDVHAAACIGEGAGVVSGTVGQNMPVRVRIRDRFGNALTYGATVGAVTMNVVYANGERTSATLQQNAAYRDAVYTTSVRELQAGNVAVSIQIGGTPMAGSTFVSHCVYMSVVAGTWSVSYLCICIHISSILVGIHGTPSVEEHLVDPTCNSMILQVYTSFNALGTHVSTHIFLSTCMYVYTFG